MFNIQDYQMWYLMMAWFVAACIIAPFVGSFIKKGHGLVRIKKKQ